MRNLCFTLVFDRDQEAKTTALKGSEVIVRKYIIIEVKNQINLKYNYEYELQEILTFLTPDPQKFLMLEK